MSYYLWKAYFEDDLDSFRRLLEASAYDARPQATRGGSLRPVIGSPVHLASSPLASAKTRRHAGVHGVALTKTDINARDATGQTLLHLAASSSAKSATEFASALIEHPLVDLYVQDHENGWTALHRAFYFGNISIARMILERDAGAVFGRIPGQAQSTVGLIKIKDREGLGPLDLYAATIKDRTLRSEANGRSRSDSNGSDEIRAGVDDDDEDDSRVLIPYSNNSCDQFYTFGSNKNVSLGFGDEDDRQFPERINLRRPEQLLRRFYTEHLEQHERKWYVHDSNHLSRNVNVSSMWVEDIPWMPKSKPLIIQDVQMAKLHTAVLTTDPEFNMYVCGHGKGGRLGLGDERTRFNFVCVEAAALAGKRVVTVALGLNHTLALSDRGEIFSWGNNSFGQLGFNLPKTTATDEDPVSAMPKQIYGPLKRETVVGIAASRIHSVAHTGDALYTFGKNEGQLGIVDSDARSLEGQVTPRKVAASLFTSSIDAVTATDNATVCLLENHDVWVFANYGYAKVQFPLEGFSNYFLQQSFRVTNYDKEPNRIVKLTCGGDTICALSSRGEIYTLSISQRPDIQASSSTTNPTKIRSAITQPLRIWSPKKKYMAARDVGVDADGSIILSTEEGSVWKRTRRVKIKDATASGTSEYKPKDYKFSRIPGLTRVLAVRASAHGAYAALRRDCDVTKTQIVVEDQTLWTSMFELLSLKQSAVKTSVDDELDSEDRHRFWQGRRKVDGLQILKRQLIESKDIENDLQDLEDRMLTDSSNTYDAVVATTTSDVRIPVHRFILTGRSRVLRRGFRDLCENSTFTIPDLAVTELDDNGRAIIKFQGLDIMAIVDLVIYLYTDNFIDFWHLKRDWRKMAYRYRQVRTDLMKAATKLELSKLERAARQMTFPSASMDMDFKLAFDDPAFFYDGDLILALEDEEVRVHSAFMRARCPFFEGLFVGRAGGRWLAGRAEDAEVNVDLSHISSKTFRLVLQYLYTDCGAELFDGIVSVGLDDFLDAVMDVMSAANELMLDRLSQICQEVIGRFVDVRNVCGLLNAVAPSSTREFKDAALEYVCLSLEAVLQGHYLNELEEDLLFELDDVVRENQLARMPFAKSGRAELLLHERNPDLAARLERNRQTRVDSVALRAKSQAPDLLVSSLFEDDHAASPSKPRARRKSSSQPNQDTSQSLLKGKAASRDTMFAMDEEHETSSPTPAYSPSLRPMSNTTAAGHTMSSPSEDTWYDARGRVVPSPKIQPQSLGADASMPKTPKSPLMATKLPSSIGQPWSFSPLPGSKTEMKDIMAQTASSRVSSLSQGLAETPPARLEVATPMSLATPKMSQRDRKRLQQAQQLDRAAPESHTGLESAPLHIPPATAWQTVPTAKTPKLGDVFSAESPTNSAKPSGSRSSSTPQLTMRQTVANPKPSSQPQKPAIGPRGQSAVQQRTASDAQATMTPPSESTRTVRQSSSSNSKPIPQSIRHQPLPEAEVVPGLSMFEILAQEQFSKDVVKEAAAKRDLQDIQAEQEFEEWWSKESARVQEAEQQISAPSAKSTKKHRGHGGRSNRRGKGKAEQSAQSSRPDERRGNTNDIAK